MNEKIMKQEATYDWLKDEVHCLNTEMNNLQKRIDKAIEYIENNELICFIDYDTKKFKNELLDILKGSDSNE